MCRASFTAVQRFVCFVSAATADFTEVRIGAEDALAVKEDSNLNVRALASIKLLLRLLHVIAASDEAFMLDRFVSLTV